MPMNRHAEFYAAGFILSREIRNRTNTHTKQTVTDISTPRLSAPHHQCTTKTGHGLEFATKMHPTRLSLAIHPWWLAHVKD